MTERARRIGQNALLVAGSLAALCIVLVVVDRVIGWVSPPTPLDEGLIFAPNSIAHYDTIEFEYRARINNLGFRGEDTAVEKKSAIRIVALGDSFTFGWGVELEDTWVKRLESRLRADGRDVEILNLGVPGFGPREYADIAEKVIPILRPDIVVVGLLQGNDLEQVDSQSSEVSASPAGTTVRLEGDAPIPVRSEAWMLPNIARIARQSLGAAGGREIEIGDAWKRQVERHLDLMTPRERECFDGLSDFMRIAFLEGRLNPATLLWLCPSTGKDPPLAVESSPNDAKEAVPPAGPAPLPPELDLNSNLIQRRIERCAEQLRRIHAAAAAHGARMIALSIPDSSWVWRSGWNLMFEQLISDQDRRIRDLKFQSAVPDEALELACSAAGIPLIVVTSEFRDGAHMGTRAYYEFDTHFTPYGNSLFADLVAPRLEPYVPK